MPRRVAPPELRDDAIRLEPLARALVPEFAWILDHDEATARFTYLPSSPDEAFLERWLGMYEDAWEDGSRAGFAIRDAEGGLAGFAAFVKLDLDGAEGELGYLVAPSMRGRGIATRAIALLTAWGLGGLRLQRIELRIDPANAASNRVAERAGYTHEGVLRSISFKEGLRTNVGVWSRLATD